jgi:hypothetical protein
MDLSRLNSFEKLHRKTQVKKLRKIGAYLRRTIMFSMRRRKGPSAPGSPPSVHEGGIKRLQRFIVNEDEMSVDNGPILYKKGIARVHEHGGVTTITVGKHKGQRVTLPARPTAEPAQRSNFHQIRQIVGE